ncbi:MAG: lytic transglycosylase domain-containing protein [Bacteroidota bacterium]
MFTSTKQLLITSFIVIIILFGFSSTIASQAVATPIYPSSVAFYSPETIQRDLLDQMIIRFNPKLNTDEKEMIIGSIITESRKNDFDPLLIASIIAAESSFRPKAVSPCEARGLMQITDCVSQIMKISNPFDIRQNIYAGTRYLKDLNQQFKNYELILAAYNAGPTRVARLGRVPRIKETINYIRRVTKFYHKIRDQLLIAINTVITQPIFNPITTSFDNCSQTPVVAIIKTNQEPNQASCPIMVENIWCEPERSVSFLLKA